MERQYLILVNGVLWERKLTKSGALKVIEELQGRKLNAVLAYSIEDVKGAI